MKKLSKIVSLLICAILLIGAVTVPVSAGNAIKLIDKDNFKTSLDGSVWSAPNSDVIVENEKIVFPKESTELTKLIWKSVSKETDVFKELTSGDITFNFVNLPKNQKFYVYFGLSSIESVIGDPGAIEVEIVNKDGICVKVSSYDASTGNKKSLSAQKNVGKIADGLKLEFIVFKGGKFTLSANGKSICKNANTGVTGEGRIGFMQTGKCHVEIIDLNLKNFAYDIPENVNSFENFDDGEYNINEFTSLMDYGSYHPSGIYIKEYKGNKALYFENVRNGYFSTKHQYSNVEVEFDVMYQENRTLADENGNFVCVRSAPLTLAFGCANNAAQLDSNIDLISSTVLKIGGARSVIQVGTKKFEAGEYKFAAPENTGKAYSLKFRVIDGMVYGYIKWKNETKYTQVFEVDNTHLPTPLGYIMIHGRETTNFVLDNLKITNLDKNPNLITLDFKSNKFSNTSGAPYKAQEVIYKNFNKAEKKPFNLYLIVAGVAVLAVLAVGVVTLVAFVSKKKALKAAALNEALNEGQGEILDE